MTRGTTPVILVKLPREIAFDTFYLTFKQAGKTVVEKTLEDVSIDGANIYAPLSQAETLAFNGSSDVLIQLRGKVGEQAYASNIVQRTVDDILKDGEI